MENNERLPIKVVVPRDHDLRPVPGRGGPRTFFDCKGNIRSTLINQLNDVRNNFKSVLDSPAKIPAVARVILKKEALSISHRPKHLFGPRSCPIIGGEDFGNILVSVSKNGLNYLEDQIKNNSTKDIAADITTLEEIKPYSANDAVGSLSIKGLSQYISEMNISSLKLKIFQHHDSTLDKNIQEALYELIRSLELPEPEPIPFLSNLLVFRIHDITADLIPMLAKFVGTQSLGVFPKFQLDTQYISKGGVTVDGFPQPAPNSTYPLVGIIDSGTDINNKLLQYNI